VEAHAAHHGGRFRHRHVHHDPVAAGQMFVAAVLAAIFRVNIPIAVIACWISNPFTFVPFSWTQIKVGNFVLPYLPSFVEAGIASIMHWLVRNLERLPTFMQEAIPRHIVEKGVEYLTSMHIGGVFHRPGPDSARATCSAG